jgi:hypothetical protein
MKRMGWTLGIVGLSLFGASACSVPSKDGAAPAAAASPSAIQVGSTLVDCGPSQRLLLEQENGVTRVRCVPGATTGAEPLVLARGDVLQPIAVDARVPAGVNGAPAPTRVSYEPRPAPRETTQRVASRDRSWKKSAAIIGGSTAAGAGVGAIMGGGGGAKKGAVVGLLGGVVYDIATRDR